MNSKIFWPLLSLGAALAFGQSAHATTYYVNAQSGNDQNDGTSSASAWQSLARVNGAALTAGDSVLLRGGQTFAGPLRWSAGQSGSENKPLVLASFGRGRARIDGDTGDGVVLDGSAFVRLENLEVVGAGRKNGSDGRGIWLQKTRSCQVNDCAVSGFRLPGVELWGDDNTRLLRVNASNNGSAGVSVLSGWGEMPRTKNLEIRDCTTDDNAGDPKNVSGHTGSGIVVGGAQNVLIDGCKATNNGWDMTRTTGGGPVGIWAWNSDRVTIQNCLSFGNKSNAGDGGGFDLDGGVTNSVLQYNLSYNNAGPGILLWQYEGAGPFHSNIVRHNVSYNDGLKSFKAAIAVSLDKQSKLPAAQITNNTFVNDRYAVASYHDGPDIVFSRNLFVAETSVFVGTLFSNSHFDGNGYWSPVLLQPWELFQEYPKDGKEFKTLLEWIKTSGQETTHGAITARYDDPQLMLPSRMEDLPREAKQIATMPYFRPVKGSLLELWGALRAEGPFQAPTDTRVETAQHATP